MFFVVSICFFFCLFDIANIQLYFHLSSKNKKIFMLYVVKNQHFIKKVKIFFINTQNVPHFSRQNSAGRKIFKIRQYRLISSYHYYIYFYFIFYILSSSVYIHFILSYILLLSYYLYIHHLILSYIFTILYVYYIFILLYYVYDSIYLMIIYI